MLDNIGHSIKATPALQKIMASEKKIPELNFDANPVIATAIPAAT
jgi:hypothetical protein